MVALCFRYHEGLIRAKEYLDSGRIGRLVSIRALMGEHLPDVRPDYRSMYLAVHNGAFELMHDLDLALWYAGQPLKKLHCIYGTYSDIGIQSPDVVEFLLDFEDRCTASVHLDFFQRPRRRQMELIGTEGVVTVEFAKWDRCTVSVYEAVRGAWTVEELATDRDDMFRAEDREFLEAVADDKPIRCIVAEGRKSVEAVFAAQYGHSHQKKGQRYDTARPRPNGSQPRRGGSGAAVSWSFRRHVHVDAALRESENPFRDRLADGIP